jgi:hypothetical protein
MTLDTSVFGGNVFVKIPFYADVVFSTPRKRKRR